MCFPEIAGAQTPAISTFWESMIRGRNSEGFETPEALPLIPSHYASAALFDVRDRASSEV
jgi:hypothetical protein